MPWYGWVITVVVSAWILVYVLIIIAFAKIWKDS
jgi:ABC-type bacteriocin/lantibiotic exporter with double-glycine peptidase domain